MVSSSQELAMKGDAAAIFRNQLDERVTRGDRERLPVRRKGQWRGEGGLVPLPLDGTVSVDQRCCAGAVEQRLRHRVPAGVEVARVTDPHPQDEHVLDLEVLT